ncbi:MAG: hypothetical protein ACRDGH_13645, partial [Candidatus Limnocylindria bacterium]
MVVLAGIVGAPGLGAEIFRAIEGLQVGEGFEAGFAVVVIAIFLDRLTGAFSSRGATTRRGWTRGALASVGIGGRGANGVG